MRLFTAIIFNEETKEKIFGIEEELRKMSVKGSFTARDNLHLTLNFIGETARLAEVKQAMKQAAENGRFNSFTLNVRGFGRFKRREGDIYWLGVEKDVSLSRLQKQLAIRLKEAGFYEIDDTEYIPHLTLGRRVLLKEDFNMKEFELGLKPITMRVERISLMKSERIEGKLVYTEIFNISLTDKYGD